jgi:hypothetical protein
MGDRIFYRRDDSSSAAGRIYDRLISYFAPDRIFMDVVNLDVGVDFVEAIEKSVVSCGTTRVLRARQLSLHQLAVKSPPAGGECAPGCRYQSNHRCLVPLQESA